MSTQKHNLSLNDKQKQLYKEAATILGTDMSEVIRHGATLFAKAVIDGDIKKIMIEKLKSE